MSRSLKFTILALAVAVPAAAWAADPSAAESCCASLSQLCCSLFGHCPLCP